MTEFAAQIRARVREAVHQLGQAELSGDHYSAEVYRADLENIADIAREHGVPVPELDALGLTAA